MCSERTCSNHCVYTNFGGNNHSITFVSHKRFGLVDTNVFGDNHVMTFGSDKLFGLVDVQRKDMQGNTAVGGKWEARGCCHHHETWIFFQCPQYSSTKKITDIVLELLQSAACPFPITTLWENGC